MRIVVPRQVQDARVALTPSGAGRLVKSGHEVVIESGAGVAAGHADEAYRTAGARILAGDAAELWSSAELVVTIGTPAPELVSVMPVGSAILGLLAPAKHPAVVRRLVERRITALSMEFLPRISRAQSMDVLSSQANLGGYKAVLLAADACPKIFPMMITAAGTIAPARVFVIGAGVAGLQAIATAKRLGAVVEAYDVRPEVEEQILSLGARFVKLATPAGPSGNGTGEAAPAAGPSAAGAPAIPAGYARQQTEDERRRQVELMARHLLASDVVISTAAVFGKPPPLLIPRDLVGRMSRGAVLVDLAADPDAKRGNCELTRPGESYVTDHGVTIIGLTNLPALVPVHSSQVYSGNMIAFLTEVLAEDKLRLNLEEEIHRGVLITLEGRVMNTLVAQAVGLTADANAGAPPEHAGLSTTER